MTSHLLLLHGALGASDQFDALVPQLAAGWVVHRLDFEGHGSRPAAPRPFDMRHFMDNVLTYMKAPRFAEALARRHTATGWEKVVHQTRAMLLELGDAGGLTPADAARAGDAG